MFIQSSRLEIVHQPSVHRPRNILTDTLNHSASVSGTAGQGESDGYSAIPSVLLRNKDIPLSTKVRKCDLIPSCVCTRGIVFRREP